MSDNNSVKVVIGLFGSQSALARALGRKQSTIWEWSANGRVPSQRIPEIIAAAARLDPPVHLTAKDFFDLPAPPRRADASAGVGA